MLPTSSFLAWTRSPEKKQFGTAHPGVPSISWMAAPGSDFRILSRTLKRGKPARSAPKEHQEPGRRSGPISPTLLSLQRWFRWNLRFGWCSATQFTSPRTIFSVCRIAAVGRIRKTYQCRKLPQAFPGRRWQGSGRAGSREDRARACRDGQDCPRTAGEVYCVSYRTVYRVRAQSVSPVTA